MGISGLLPALKSIQNTRHLSEFSGQTIAVDAYVWLHKGVYTCATELATGKATKKYVDYAMGKVRLLRHHGIEPYLVFDGGPLPAKKGTEVERKRKREENLARGNLLASQGKHSQARECYLKCVDITPQMAFQVIKALRAESVRYVVAPYEADAQLAFLERSGLVSGILTEDSDLLVFGCKNVLLKLDTVARTVIHISRADFASVSASAMDTNSISLVGWSDNQFRAMAILSGCDYLPSIPGIGLKTACTLLRKWKTPEAVVRCIAREGKKPVPKGYLENFKLAEKCFLHQRVYDPSSGRLIYLNEVDPSEWSEDAEAYVGSDLDPAVAKKLAMGDIDPITLEAMEDINPEFAPASASRARILKDIPVASTIANTSPKGKGRAHEKPVSGGILSFFGPNPIIPPRVKPSTPKIVNSTMSVGKASGKRTLSEVMDQDLAEKKKKRHGHSTPTLSKPSTSKFFGAAVIANATTPENEASPVAGPSRARPNKENEYILIEDSEDEEGNDADSLVAQRAVDSEMDIPFEEDMVEQEDGYISPSPSRWRDTEELSSPPRPGSPRGNRGSYRVYRAGSPDLNLQADVLSSPASVIHPRSSTHTREGAGGRVLVDASPEAKIIGATGVVKDDWNAGDLDLRDSFGDELASDIDCSDDEAGSSPSLSPLTPDEMPDRDRDQITVVEAFEHENEDVEETESRAVALRNEAVATGWRNRWALNGSNSAGVASVGKHVSSTTSLRRRETNVTPVGRHRLGGAAQSADGRRCYLYSSAASGSRSSSVNSASRSVAHGSRKSLVFFEDYGTGSRTDGPVASPDFALTASVSLEPMLQDAESLAVAKAKSRLACFRCP